MDNQTEWIFDNEGEWIMLTAIQLNLATQTNDGLVTHSGLDGCVGYYVAGVGQVNGWSDLKAAVAANAANIASNATAIAGKQNALTAGSNIQISGNTISATNTVPNNGTLTIQQDGTTKATFMADQPGNTTANIDLSGKQATLASSTSNTISGNQVQRAALTGDVTAPANSNATTIANNAVTTAKIADKSITPTKVHNTGVAQSGWSEAENSWKRGLFSFFPSILFSLGTTLTANDISAMPIGTVLLCRDITDNINNNTDLLSYYNVTKFFDNNTVSRFEFRCSIAASSKWFGMPFMDNRILASGLTHTWILCVKIEA